MSKENLFLPKKTIVICVITIVKIKNIKDIISYTTRNYRIFINLKNFSHYPKNQYYN